MAYAPHGRAKRGEPSPDKPLSEETTEPRTCRWSPPRDGTRRWSPRDRSVWGEVSLTAPPPGRRDSVPGVAQKSPWSLAFIVGENRQFLEGAEVVPTRQRDVSLGLVSLEKPLELSCDRYREPDQGALGQCPPAREACLWAWRRSKSPWSLAFIVIEDRQFLE
ncbi:hypothetical protein G5714_024550 [Onychostoma macrolepis]|uniref:Uncharacterized protein n=1 Tax=Onychostoma macrolepis TaxID=369639 RepID=A0A7J6BJT1_9TELE|nr:hypothetical protein G5714_024550 [Onychostoma macrolepis]